MLDVQYVWVSFAFLGLFWGIKGLRPFGVHYNPKYCVICANKLNTSIRWKEFVCESCCTEVELN